MRRQTWSAVLVLGLLVVLAGCTSSPTAPGASQGEREASTFEVKGGNGNGNGGSGGDGGGDGGGGEDPTATLADGMTGSGPLPVQKNSGKEVNLQGPMDVATEMSATQAAAVADGCQVMQGPDDVDQGYLHDLLVAASIHRFRVVVAWEPGALGGTSSRHRVTLNWDEGGASYNLNVTEDVTVTVVDNGDGTSTYTYAGGFVRITDKRGRKDTVRIRCANLDQVSVTLPNL